MNSQRACSRDSHSPAVLPVDMYRRRFQGMADYRRALWRVLCRDWFQRFVAPTDAVLDLAAGYCDFINAIRAARRTAVDINPDIRLHAEAGVEVIVGAATRVEGVADGSQDVVFMSNFLEHLTREEIVAVVRECRRLLRDGGRLMILQPNIRYASRDYWMFFDHITPVDDRALCEVLELNGFAIEQCIPRFLPYSTVSRVPKALFLVRLYLRMPLVWRWFGKQAFVLGRKR